jgi:CSLREA domain-containing protein
MPTMKKTTMLRQLTLLGAALTLLLGFGVAQATTYTVTTTADSSDGACTSSLCSLRDAITAANADTAADTINFNIPSGATGCVGTACTITLNSTLPSALGSLTLDGTGQSITISGNNLFQVENNNGTLTVNALTIVNAFGGAIFNNGTLTVTNSTFSGNSGGGFGGAITNNGGTLTVTNSTFSNNNNNNLLGFGGAIENNGGTLTVTNSTFSGNTATEGGAIYLSQGTMSVTNSTFSGNTSTGAGGAIYCTNGCTFLNSTFSGNTAGEGGAIFLNQGTMSVTNSTFSGNVGNNGGNDGFAVYSANNNGAVLTLINSIVAGSTGGNCNAVSDGGGNLSDDTTCSFTPSTNNSVTTLDLATLANNGGPTQTIALLSGSQAIGFDKANCPATDQRGVPRPSSTLCDAGAYQTVTPPTLTCPTNTAQVGVAYSSALGVSGGVSPYTYSISSGSLPDGLNLNTSTGAITGMPGTMGLFTFTGKVVDSPLDGSQTGSTSPSCQIKVSPAAVLLQLSVTPTSLPFGSVYQFSLLLKTVTLKNTGTGAISLGRVSVTPGTGADRNNFTPLSFCPSSLAVGKSCAIIVVLFADNLGSLSATLNIPNNATTSPQAVALSATVTKRGH